METVLKHAPLVMLLSYMGKMLFVSASPAEMGIVFALTALVAIEKYTDHKEIKATIAKQNEVIEKMAKEVVELRTSVGAFKMQQGMKRVG